MFQNTTLPAAEGRDDEEPILVQEAQDETQREMVVKEDPETPSLLSRARFQASAWECQLKTLESHHCVSPWIGLRELCRISMQSLMTSGPSWDNGHLPCWQVRCAKVPIELHTRILHEIPVAFGSSCWSASQPTPVAFVAFLGND